MGGLTLPAFNIYCKATIVKTVWYWHKGRHDINQFKRIESQEMKPKIFMVNHFLTNSIKPFNGDIPIFPTNVRKTWYPCAKERSWTLTLCHLQKLIQKRSKINIWVKMIKLSTGKLSVDSWALHSVTLLDSGHRVAVILGATKKSWFQVGASV